MNNSPLISIIVPCYNDGNYIHECLNSIHEQEYKNYEVIVINDGSTDQKTNEILGALNHPKIKVLQTPNQGPALARNEAIRNSTGKYILPLDADNKVGKIFIQEAIAILEKKADVKIVNCDVQFFGAKKAHIRFEAYTMEKLLAENVIECASIYRRKDFDQTIGYNPNMKEGLEDWDFWLSILEKGGEVQKIDKAEIFYRVKKGSRNSSIRPEGLKRLRQQIYTNHKLLYAKHFFDPMKSFEYQLIIKSKEYRLGTFLLKPIRFIHKLF